MSAKIISETYFDVKGKNPPKKEETEELWDYDDVSFIKIDGSLFSEVQWSDEEPKKVKLVIDK